MGRKSVVKERFSKKYRHPVLDSKLTLKRLNAVRFRKFLLCFTLKLCILSCALFHFLNALFHQLFFFFF